MKYLLPFLNPLKWIKAFRFAKQNSKFDKSTYDLELFLYSKILTNNMLHYGYFENIHVKSESLSIKQLEDAQVKYAKNIIAYISDFDNPVLDVGCGMGGLAELIHHKKIQVECLTPNKNQIEFINKTYRHLTTHNYKFETFKSNKKYGTIINSESLQYISLKCAFEKLDEIILTHGRWIVVDYFRLNDSGISKSGHLLEDFFQKLREFNWTIKYECDITLNILPTIAYVNMYVERFLLPLKHFGYEKLRYKKPKIYYMASKLKEAIENKIDKEKASVDPKKFIKERKYMFFVLEKYEPNMNLGLKNNIKY